MSGGLIASIVFGLIYGIFDLQFEFALDVRDELLIAFFTTIGLSSRFSTLLKGGSQLGILLVLAVVYLMIQNGTGVLAATLAGYDQLVGVIGGSVSLSGGHGTAIAWTEVFRDDYGIQLAGEIGIACATFGLVLGGLVGRTAGPVPDRAPQARARQRCATNGRRRARGRDDFHRLQQHDARDTSGLRRDRHRHSDRHGSGIPGCAIAHVRVLPVRGNPRDQSASCAVPQAQGAEARTIPIPGPDLGPHPRVIPCDLIDEPATLDAR